MLLVIWGVCQFGVNITITVNHMTHRHENFASHNSASLRPMLQVIAVVLEKRFCYTSGCILPIVSLHDEDQGREPSFHSFSLRIVILSMRIHLCDLIISQVSIC